MTTAVRPYDDSPEGDRARAWRSAVLASRTALALAERASRCGDASQLRREMASLETLWALAVASLLRALLDDEPVAVHPGEQSSRP